MGNKLTMVWWALPDPEQTFQSIYPSINQSMTQCTGIVRAFLMDNAQAHRFAATEQIHPLAKLVPANIQTAEQTMLDRARQGHQGSVGSPLRSLSFGAGCPRNCHLKYY